MKRNGHSRSLSLLILFAFVVSMGPAAMAGAAFSDLNLITAIQDVARKAIPSVVHIEVTENRRLQILCCHFRAILSSSIISEIPKCPNNSKGR